MLCTKKKCNQMNFTPTPLTAAVIHSLLCAHWKHFEN